MSGTVLIWDGFDLVEIDSAAVMDWKIDCIEDDGEQVTFAVQVPTLRGVASWTTTTRPATEIPEDWQTVEVMAAIEAAKEEAG